MGLVLIHVTNAVTNAPLMSLSCVGMCQNTHVTLTGDFQFGMLGG
jgi:hypothetical protein